MEKLSPLSRRQFLASTAGALTVPYFIPARALGKDASVAPSERITIGIIGIGGMGRTNSRGFMRNDDAQVVAVCDVDKTHLERGARRVNRHYDNEDCKQYSDFRELIAHPDLDAVCIATPDHWHALCAIAAANAKKDIFCQKPVTHTFAEGQAVVQAVEKNNVVFQVGSQQRSRADFRHAVELVRNGHIGRVKHIEIGLPTGPTEPQGDPKPQDPPPEADYDFWTGPAPLLPFIPARFHYQWRWHLAYGGGQLMDWIGHHNDIAHWSMGMDRSGPREVYATGFEYPPDKTVYNAAWKYEIWCKYANGVTTSISNKYERGCRWIGEDGWIFISRGKHAASQPAWTAEGYDPGPEKVYFSPEHHRNFLDCVKTRKQCVCPAETGHRSITPGHLGLLSEALGGRKIQWDPRRETVIGDPEAERLLKSVVYRKPWDLEAITRS